MPWRSSKRREITRGKQAPGTPGRGLDIECAAELLGLKVPTLYILSKKPDFPAPRWRVGGRNRWDREDLLNWKRNRVERRGRPRKIKTISAD
jgi:predicted DNA-binding transcriptional regulator AlpA